MTINHNSSPSLIKDWQTFLNGQGFASGTPDGIWGPHTTSASQRFQQAHRLSADGIVGPATIQAAEAAGFAMPQTAVFNPAGTLNAVFDISHLNEYVDLAQAKAGGMQAVFQKATQSGGATLYHDKTYPTRRTAAKAAGLLWGAYHFGTAGDGTQQASEFLAYAQPDKDTLLVLDFERCTTTGESTMSEAEAIAFINEVKAQTGKYPGIYGGSLLKSVMQSNPQSELANCWLWIAQYSSAPQLPEGWSEYTFWQYTDGTNGPGAVPVAGVGKCDRDIFRGTAAELTAFWRSHAV